MFADLHSFLLEIFHFVRDSKIALSGRSPQEKKDAMSLEGKATLTKVITFQKKSNVGNTGKGRVFFVGFM
jgi:hypothetical protein